MSNEPWNQQPPQSGQSAPNGWENSDWVPASAEGSQASANSAPLSDATTTFPQSQMGYPGPGPGGPAPAGGPGAPPMGPQPGGMSQPGFPAQGNFQPQGGFPPQQQGGGAWVGPPPASAPGLGTVFDFSFRQNATPYILKYAMFALIALGLVEWALLSLFGFQWSVAYSVWKAVADDRTSVDVNYALGIVAVVLGWVPGAVQLLLGRVFLEGVNRYLSSPPR